MVQLLYNLGIHTYVFFIRTASLWLPKAKQWIQGRQQLSTLHQQIRQLPAAEATVWMHCASLGEFEQGRPLLESLKKSHPKLRVVLTFFSPSGYEIRKNYPNADIVTYLPIDIPKNVQTFLDTIQPTLVIFVKYEFWYHFLRGVANRKIPLLLIAAKFRKEQLFFKWYGHFFREMLLCFTHIFLQDEGSASLLSSVGYQPFTVNGDPRVDRVAQLAQNKVSFPMVKAFCDAQPTFICGSTWPADHQVLIPFINQYLPPAWKVIIAPHEIQPFKIDQLITQIKQRVIKYSQANEHNIKDHDILIIDNVGMLNALYQYGHISYIGGAFGKGLHNILEPLSFGLPVIFGPKYHKFDEANEMVNVQVAFAIQDLNGMKTCFEDLLHTDTHQKAQAQAIQFIEKNKGATQQIVETIFRKKWLS